MFDRDAIGNLAGDIEAVDGGRSAVLHAGRAASLVTRWGDWARERRRTGRPVPDVVAEVDRLHRAVRDNPHLSRRRRDELIRAVGVLRELTGPPAPAVPAGR